MTHCNVHSSPAWLVECATSQKFCVLNYHTTVVQPFTGTTVAWIVSEKPDTVGFRFWMTEDGDGYVFGSPYPWVIRCTHIANAKELAVALITTGKRGIEIVQDFVQQKKVVDMRPAWFAMWPHVYIYAKGTAAMVICVRWLLLMQFCHG